MFAPEVGSTVAIIRSKLSQLGPGERSVAEALLADPAAASRMGAGELAARAGTSAATVTRACQSMGFPGFPHVRTLLVRDVGAQQAASRDPHDSAHPVRRMYAEAARELEAAASTVDVDEFDACVESVVSAGRVAILGSGSSAATVASTALRFLLSGIPVESASDAIQQLLTARLLAPGDVVLAVSDSGENAATLAAASAAREAGATVVAVTSFPRSRLAAVADRALIVGASGRPWPESVLTSTLLQTFLLNALVVESAARRPERRAAETGMDELMRVVTGASPPPER